VAVEIVNFSETPKRLVGAKSRRAYGYVKNGQKLKMYKVDVEVRPDYFLMQESEKSG
jgi:hypothetical protein